MSFKSREAKPRSREIYFTNAVYINVASISWSLTPNHLISVNVHIVSQLQHVLFVIRTGSIQVNGLSNDNLTHFINKNALRFGEEPKRGQCLSSYTLNKFLQVKLLICLI